MIISNKLIISPSDECYPVAKLFCENDLTFDNPAFQQAERMGFWTGNIPRKIRLYTTDSDNLLLPFGCYRQFLPFIQGKTFGTDFAENEPNKMKGKINLYDYQETAVRKLYMARNGILIAPTGAGKTMCGLALIKQLGKKALWLTHTKDLLLQSKERCEAFYSGDFGTITEGKVNIGRDVTFATVQTMAKQDLSLYKYAWDVIVVDECLPKGTMILTPDGEKELSTIKLYDTISTYNVHSGKIENKKVLNVFRNKAHDILKITLNNGKTIFCTSNHPFYTKTRGYVEAKDLRSDDNVMLHLRQRSNKGNVQQIWLDSSEEKREGVLFKGMQNNKFKNCRETLFSRNIRKMSRKHEKSKREVQKTNNRKNEKQQSEQRPQNKRKDKTNKRTKRHIACVRRDERRKWLRFNGYTRENDECSVRKRFRSNTRICNTHKSKRVRLSNLLQIRLSNTLFKIRDRIRWAKSLWKKNAGRKKGYFFEWIRVESIENQEQTSDGTFGGICSDGYVYNIETEDNNNYFANGILVHNCQRLTATPNSTALFQTVLNNLAARHKYGLTASLSRADRLQKCAEYLIGEVVYEIPREAVADKIINARVEAVKLNTPESLAYLGTDGMLNYTKLLEYLCANHIRNSEIARRLNENAEHYNLILSDRTEHLRSIMSLVERQDLCCMVDGKMTSKKSKELRRQYIEQMRTGEKRFLFATYGLAKEGLDIPCLDRLYLTTPHKDKSTILQSVGRIRRKCEGKGEPIVYDFVDDNIEYCVKAHKTRRTTYKKIDCIIDKKY